MSIFEDGSYSCIPGTALIAKVLAGRCRMKYTRAAVGRGNIPDGESPKTMTQPAGYVMDAKISSVTNPVGGECQVTVQVNSRDVENGFYVTGILLYAEDPDEGEVPYTYLALENAPEWIRPSDSVVGKLATFDLIAAVGDIDLVTATIDPDSIATREVVEQMIAAATVRREITVPKTGWADSRDGGGGLSVDIPQEDVTEEMVPVVSILPAYAGIAKDCGMGTAARTLDGKLRFYAEKAPDAEIHAELTLLQASSGRAGGVGQTGGTGQGSSGYTLPVATGTRLGGVKIGKNVDVGTDGTISVDAADSGGGDVLEMLDRVFGSPGAGVEGNPGTGDYSLPVATQTQLGGVKIGENVNVEPDGTISVDGTDVLDGAAATGDDTQEMLDHVFGSMDTQ